MDLILIDSTKLKIMLSANDMSKYSLTCDNIEYDNTESRRAFWDILRVAKLKTGFDAANNRVFIQVYPSKDGGCEMYITKINNDDDDDGLYYDDNMTIQEKTHLKKDSVNTERGSFDIYSFNEFSWLLEGCRHLKLSGYNNESRLWVDDNSHRYYLAVKSAKKRYYRCLDEYGIKHSAPVTYTYINEHCRCIITDEAIEKLSILV
ncbi:MAG: adaptor protein MecA [Eubacteriales bacterium]|nr:adaptor protein MecA [Eubacteriales bacterium]